MKFLTDTERAQLRLHHKRERDSRICDRIKSVILFNDGWTPDNIAKTLLITEDSVLHHIKEYQNSRKLKPENGGSIEKFSEQQSQSLEKHLDTHIYLHVKDIANVC